MANSEPWDITGDDELKSAVRGETQYDTSTLPTDDLDGLVASAKRVLALKADVTAFYDDRGIAVALFGITAAKCKGAVENSPVRVKNLTGQDVTFRTSSGDSLQLSEYEEMTRLGLNKSEKTDAGVRRMRVTNDFLSNT